MANSALQKITELLSRKGKDAPDNVSDEAPAEDMDVGAVTPGVEAPPAAEPERKAYEMGMDGMISEKLGDDYESPEIGYKEKMDSSIAKNMGAEGFSEWDNPGDPWKYSGQIGKGVEDTVFYATSPEGRRIKVTYESDPEVFEAIARTNPEVAAMLGEEPPADPTADLGESPGAEPTAEPDLGESPAGDPAADLGESPAGDPAAKPAEDIEFDPYGMSPAEVTAYVKQFPEKAAEMLRNQSSRDGKVNQDIAKGSAQDKS